MDKTNAEEVMKELTMLLMYLSRFSERDRFSDGRDFYAWKGYDFDVINGLDEEDYIRQGSHPSRTKSVYITDTGIDYAKKLMKKYGIEDWG
ncbi:MAG: DUF6429 family protein [Clostridiales bacterium]|nr:DUF6429 family protein [Clostridiales bacterium]